MSYTPKTCPFCGCTEIDSDGYPEINGGRHVRFGCGSVWIEGDSIQKAGWVRDQLWCGGKVGELYRRISQAAGVLADAQRYGIWVDAVEVDKAIEKLIGKPD